MNREAAVLGVPVYSIFRGKIGTVDKHVSTRTNRDTGSHNFCADGLRTRRLGSGDYAHQQIFRCKPKSPYSVGGSFGLAHHNPNGAFGVRLHCYGGVGRGPDQKSFWSCRFGCDLVEHCVHCPVFFARSEETGERKKR
jgi:hypothetical protein